MREGGGRDLREESPPPRRLRFYAPAGYRPTTGSEGRGFAVFTMFCAFAGPLAAGYAVFYLLYDDGRLWQGAIPSLVVALIALAPFLWPVSPLLALAFANAAAFIAFPALTYLFGAETFFFVYLLLTPTITMAALGAGRPKFLAVVVACATAAMLLSLTVLDRAALLEEPDPVFISMARISAALFALTMAAIFGFIAHRRADRSEALLALEHARSEALLENLLPAEIARRLKADPGGVIADEVEEMTVLFADIVDFTPRAARMAPGEVVALLNRVFSAFDNLAAQRGLEKIKTIGDAYIVAAGLPTARADHAVAIADMALDMLDAVRGFGGGGDEAVRIRIGVHSGPAVAGVIGQREVFYDVWGDDQHGRATRKPWRARPHPRHGGFRRRDGGPLRLRAARSDQVKGQGPCRDLLAGQPGRIAWGSRRSVRRRWRRRGAPEEGKV